MVRERGAPRLPLRHTPAPRIPTRVPVPCAHAPLPPCSYTSRELRELVKAREAAYDAKERAQGGILQVWQRGGGMVAVAALVTKGAEAGCRPASLDAWRQSLILLQFERRWTRHLWPPGCASGDSLALPLPCSAPPCQGMMRRFAGRKALWDAAVDCMAQLDALMSLAVAAACGSGTMCRPKLVPWSPAGEKLRGLRRGGCQPLVGPGLGSQAGKLACKLLPCCHACTRCQAGSFHTVLQPTCPGARRRRRRPDVPRPWAAPPRGGVRPRRHLCAQRHRAGRAGCQALHCSHRWPLRCFVRRWADLAHK